MWSVVCEVVCEVVVGRRDTSATWSLAVDEDAGRRTVGLFGLSLWSGADPVSVY